MPAQPPAAQADQPVRDRVWIFGLSVLLPVIAMLLRGRDANWDLRNYHLYNVHAWLTGRELTDIAPAQLQSWHNPLLDLPLYLLIHSGSSPLWASLWLTLPTIAAIFFLLRLQQAVSPVQPSRSSQSVLALLALTGAATYSTLALSMNDSFVAAAMLGSLLLVLGHEDDASSQRRWFLAGLLAAAITGLKLAAFFYCFGLAFSALVGGPWKQRIVRLGSTAAGGVIGFVLTYGYWGWHLFATRQNPFFPYYNNYFHSPDAMPDAWADARFRPDSIWDALSSPVQLLLRSRDFSELTLSDPRILAGLLALLALYALAGKQVPQLRRRLGVVLVFFTSSWLLWAWQYGIYRYAIVLELLGSLALVLLLQRLPAWRNTALLAAALLVSADTKRPNWGHVRSNNAWLGMVAPGIPGDSLVLIASGEPLAFFALGLPDSVPIIAVANNLMSPHSCTRLQLRAARVIAGHRGPIWLLGSDAAGGHSVSGDNGQALVSRFYGLQAAGPCKPFSSDIGSARLCPQRRSAAVAAAGGAACNPPP